MAKQNTYASVTPALGDKIFIVDVSDTVVDANGASKNVLVSALKTLVNTSPEISGTVTGDGLATQAEAEAGTNNDQLMTPLRTLQAIDQFAIARGATWTRVEGSRSFGTEYQNADDKPMEVLIRKSTGTNDMSVYMGATSGALTLVTAAPPVNYAQIGFIVPPEWYYRVESADSLQFWSELS